MTILSRDTSALGRFVWPFVLTLTAATSTTVCLGKDEEIQFPSIVSFNYLKDEQSYSVGSPHLGSDITVTTLPGGDANGTRIAISSDFLKNGFELKHLQIAAVTNSGKTAKPTNVSAAEEAARDGAPATIISEFDIAKEEIHRLILQNSKLNKSDPMTLELVALEKNDDVVTRWGTIADLDGDCAVIANNQKLAMTIPPGSHDLAPGRQLNAPFVLNQISGDFTFHVKVIGDFEPGKVSLGQGAAYNGAGIVLWEDVKNYLRVERNAYWTSAKKIYSDSPLIEYWRNHQDMGFNTEEAPKGFYKGRATWLKVKRKSDDITILLSHDGTEWTEIKTFKTELPEELFVGVLAINTSDKPFPVAFEKFSLRAQRLIAPAIISRAKSEQK